MREIHDRMPLILGRSEEAAWLEPEIHDQETLQKLFKPCPSSWLTAVEISPLVNSPKNNTPAVSQSIVAAKTSDERVLRSQVKFPVYRLYGQVTKCPRRLRLFLDLKLLKRRCAALRHFGIRSGLRTFIAILSETQA